ncbi:MAG TPA: TraR/DksA family transcriptional regulator [Gammaproteobacteria bacterium]|nr:TraR/DksA family transcriptional regulator [Gammaproteobacteria bacterium]
MNDDDIEHIRASLLRLKAELQAREEASGEAAGTVELDQARVGRLSRMDALQAQQMALETARRRQDRLTKIEGALRRIATDDYGYCFVCGEALDLRRLSVDPTSTRCMKCADG